MGTKTFWLRHLKTWTSLNRISDNNRNDLNEKIDEFEMNSNLENSTSPIIEEIEKNDHDDDNNSNENKNGIRNNFSDNFNGSVTDVIDYIQLDELSVKSNQNNRQVNDAIEKSRIEDDVIDDVMNFLMIEESQIERKYSFESAFESVGGFSEKEKKVLSSGVLRNKEYLIEEQSAEENSILLGLIDLLFAFCFDHR